MKTGPGPLFKWRPPHRPRRVPERQLDEPPATMIDPMALQTLAAEIGRQVVAPLIGQLTRLERAVSERRRPISSATKATITADALALGGRCPCCGVVEVVTPTGDRQLAAEFDHFYASSMPNAAHVWLICTPCHLQLTTGRVERHRREAQFRAFQENRRRLSERQGGLSLDDA